MSYGIPAFNVNNMEQVQAIMQAAHECDSPVIVQGSAGARKYAGEPFLRHLLEAAIEDTPNGLHAASGAGIRTVVTRSLYGGTAGFEGALAVLDRLGDPGSPCRVLQGPGLPGGMVTLVALSSPSWSSPSWTAGSWTAGTPA